MRKPLFVALAVAFAALGAGAAPALTDSTGTVAVSVKAQAPAAACLTVSPSSVDFGTLRFSTDNLAGQSGTQMPITVNFCGSAVGQNLFGSTTPASGSSGSWMPQAYDGSSVHPCPTPNQFYLEIAAARPTAFRFLTQDNAPVADGGAGPAAVFPIGDEVFQLALFMPCQGSNGAGETKALTVTLTAVPS
jgi:hypothetical protein